MALRRGILRQELSKEVGKSRRGYGLRQYAQPVPFVDVEESHGLAEGRDKRIPCVDAPVQADGLRAIGIVKREKRCLSKSVGGAKTGRMFGVAFNLDRPPFVAF